MKKLLGIVVQGLNNSLIEMILKLEKHIGTEIS